MRIAATAVLCLIMFAAFFFLERHWFTFLGGEQIQDAWPSWFMPIVFAASTFVGIFSRSIFEIVKKTNAPKTYKGILDQAVAPNSLLLSLIVAPVIMSLLYKALRGTDDILLVVVSSYQNGFFWKTVLRR